MKIQIYDTGATFKKLNESELYQLIMRYTS